MVPNIRIGNDMPAPLVGLAVAAAAKLAAKKLAQQGAKKAAKTAATRARSNSAAAAKAVAPKKPKGSLVPARKTPTGAIKINSGNTTKTPPKPAKTQSYWELKGMPSLVKVNSGKGNTTVSPLKNRVNTIAAKRATGRKGQ